MSEGTLKHYQVSCGRKSKNLFAFFVRYHLLWSYFYTVDHLLICLLPQFNQTDSETIFFQMFGLRGLISFNIFFQDAQCSSRSGRKRIHGVLAGCRWLGHVYREGHDNSMSNIPLYYPSLGYSRFVLVERRSRGISHNMVYNDHMRMRQYPTYACLYFTADISP